jgi:hypothetical protein
MNSDSFFMKKSLLLTLLVGWALAASSQGTQPLSRLRVSTDGRYLEREASTPGVARPFFWLGDTAWNLMAQLDGDETRRYLDDRAAKGFTVVQTHLPTWTMTTPSVHGHLAFLNGNFDQPNEAYWRHVDTTVAEAARRGLYLAVLPVWARTYIDRLKNEPPQLDSLEAYRYARFLGQRYRAYPHLIWVLGGDVRPTRHATYRALARGLTETYADGDPARILLTYHPPGGTYRPPATSTGEFYHDEPWLDLNLIQSGHALENRSYERIAEDVARRPAKPTLDSEPCYEHHPVKHDYKNGAFSAWHVRRRGYWSLLAGAAGFTYGGNGVWQMDKPGRVMQPTHFKAYWYVALNHEGAQQMRHLRHLAEMYQWTTWVPDSTLVTGPLGGVDDRIQSVRTADGTCFLHYSTNGRPVALTPLPAGRWRSHWFDPRTGKTGSPQPVRALRFTPPTSGEGADWVLVLTRAQ